MHGEQTDNCEQICSLYFKSLHHAFSHNDTNETQT